MAHTDKIKTGLDKIDEILSGGLKKGEFTMIIGVPKRIGHPVTLKNADNIIFTSEISKEELERKVNEIAKTSKI